MDAERFPLETRVEAIDRAWRWGTGGRRLIPRAGLLRPFAPVAGAGIESRLRSLLDDTRLFAPAARSRFASPVFDRAATTYLDPKPWRPGVVGVGERVLALDPPLVDRRREVPARGTLGRQRDPWD